MIDRSNGVVALAALIFLGLAALPASAEDRIFIEPELLSLKFSQSDTAYAIELDPDASMVGGHVRRLEPDSSSGFRLGVGWHVRKDWDVILRYTSIDNDASGTASGPDGVGPLLTHPDDLSEADSATATLDQDFSSLNLEVGRSFGRDQDYRARVFAGPGLIEFEQTTAVVYDDSGDPWTVDVGNDVEASGVRFGAEGELLFGSDGSIFARAVVGAYIASHDLVLLEVDQTDPDQAIVSVAESLNGSSLSIEAALGFGWEWHLQHRTISAQLGYEVNAYSNFINTRAFVDDIHEANAIAQSDDLGLDGLFLKLKFAF